MSRKKQILTLNLIVGVSVAFGYLVGTTVKSHSVSAAEAAPASPARVSGAVLPLAQAVTAPSFAEIAERADPSIVTIQNTEFVKRSRRPEAIDPFHWFFNDPFGSPDRSPEGPQGEGQEEDRREGSGSGFIISKDGHILTNYHVVARANRLAVTLNNGEKYPATVKGKDESIDLALLKIDAPHQLQPLPLGNSDTLRTGEWVIAIGNPLGYEHSVTVGVISGKGRPLSGLNPDRGLANYLQTDAAINFGNSGGPLLNVRGEVVGINTAITRGYPGYVSGVVQGIGFALPINHVTAVLDQLMTTGRVARGYLSIQIDQVGEDKQKFYGLPSRKGAFVQKVNDDGPAARAGVKGGDIILSVDGREVEGTDDLIQMVSSQRPGDTVNLGIFRCREGSTDACDGKNLTVKVKLADRTDSLIASRDTESQDDEEAGGRSESDVRLGFSVAEISPARFREVLGSRMLLPGNHPRGVLVTRVSNQGPAYEAGLRPGYIITKVGLQPVTSVADFRRAVGKIRKGEVVRLAVSFYLEPAPRGETPQPESRFIFFEVE